ncbi:DUF4330 domain-containing protein [Vallitalea guaymasensis]|uniref:DUF4330 domain-containing protein n=1 Tax=Vallitalea guaymasensis TaxID=1185412 RepID=A0A8J8SCS2_9FIRM|nr:DUF4330 domain-containing protein [Vallitalea guaymasensis]QUH30143.1 DUF4330 domain-containing protein [Vallitalea guaymasensis]
MKIIDKNGKLFGKINIMDIIIILLVIVIVFAVYSKFNKNDSGTAVSSTKQDIYIVAEAYSQVPEIAESIVEGETLVAQNKYQPGNIDYVEITDDDYVATTKDGKLVAAKDTSRKTIEVGIKCKANINGPYIDSGGQEIKVGLPYWIKTSNGQIKGVVKEIRLEQ